LDREARQRTYQTRSEARKLPERKDRDSSDKETLEATEENILVGEKKKEI